MAVVTSFSADVVAGNIPFYVTFTDTSTGSPDRWWWDFGDGSVGSTLQNPTHTYLCQGTYSVTLTSWVDDGEGYITSTTVSTLIRTVSEKLIEPTVWGLFLVKDWVSGSGGTRYNYGNSPTIPKTHAYTDRKATFNLDLTAQVKGDSVIILQYYERLFNYGTAPCAGVNNWEIWWSNDRLGDIPILKLSGLRAFAHRSVQMISSPDLAVGFDHAGESFDIEVKNAKTQEGAGGDIPEDAIEYPCLFQRLTCGGAIDDGCILPSHSNWTEDLEYQRLGFSCTPPPPADGNGVSIELDHIRAVVHSFTSIDSYTATNYITTSSNIISRPAVLFSGIKEAWFKDGWENEKHLYIEQPKANPCIIQFVDVYANTENDK